MLKNLRPDHFTILADDLIVTEEFYSDILGFTNGPRPDFRFPGLWLYLGDAAVLHVIKTEELPTPRKGVLDHMAFRAEGINDLLFKLKARNLDYKIKRTPDPWVQWQVFFKDPNGVDVEVDFDGNETLSEEFKV